MPFIETVRFTLQCLNPPAVIAAVAAGEAWNDRRDVPDVAGFRDFAHAPDQTVQLLRTRISDGQLTGQTHKMPLAKPDPSKSSTPLRWACILDPLTELGMRLHLSAAVDMVEERARALGDDVVCAGRVQSGQTPAGWSQLAPGYLLDRRADDILDAINNPTWWALGQTDIKSCYPSLTPAAISGGLADSGVPDSIIEPVRQLLFEVRDLWRYKGLPIGPEWAPVLANAALFRLDNDLLHSGVQHSRWIDDVAFVLDGFGFFEAVRAFERSLQRLGLEANRSKYQYTKDRKRALAEFVDPEIAAMRLAATTTERIDIARRVYAESVSGTSPHRVRRLRFALGILSGRGLADVLPFVIANPDLLAVAPRHHGQYVKRLLAEGGVDRDWVIDRATRHRTDRDAIGQLHLLRACAEARCDWGTDHADAFLECADDTSVTTPVRCWAATAYARTSAFKANQAADRAEGTGDTHLQRAWTIALTNRQGRKVRSAARRLKASYPTCSPAAQLVLDGA